MSKIIPPLMVFYEGGYLSGKEWGDEVGQAGEAPGAVCMPDDVHGFCAPVVEAGDVVATTFCGCEVEDEHRFTDRKGADKCAGAAHGHMLFRVMSCAYEYGEVQKK